VGVGVSINSIKLWIIKNNDFYFYNNNKNNNFIDMREYLGE
jgi:hypothetical protein